MELISVDVVSLLKKLVHAPSAEIHAAAVVAVRLAVDVLVVAAADAVAIAAAIAIVIVAVADRAGRSSFLSFRTQAHVSFARAGVRNRYRFLRTKGAIWTL